VLGQSLQTDFFKGMPWVGADPVQALLSDQQSGNSFTTMELGRKPAVASHLLK
jgi:hypothetical protein